MPINKRIILKLMSKLDLNQEELSHVFNDIGLRVVPHYIKTCRAIRYLLKNLEGEQKELLIKVINQDFQIWPHYRVSLDTLEDVFDCWQFRCNNKETEKFLIDLAKKLQEKEKNSALNDFKDSLSK